MGYGAIRLAGPHVFGPPADRDAAIAVLREVVEVAEAQSIAPVACVQNFYNLANRSDDAFVDDLARQVSGAALVLPADAVAELDGIAG